MLLKGVRDPRRTVIMTHVPPYDSGLDTAPLLSPDLRPTVSAGDVLRGPVGSTGVRRAIESFRICSTREIESSRACSTRASESVRAACAIESARVLMAIESRLARSAAATRKWPEPRPRTTAKNYGVHSEPIPVTF